MRLAVFSMAALLTLWGGKMEVRGMGTGVEPEIEKVIRQYAAQHKKCDSKDYRIERKKDENGYSVYWIICLEDEKSPVTGGGKSVAVYYDPARKKIVREMAFQ